MIKPDDATIAAIVGLQNGAGDHWKTYMGWLQASFQATVDNLIAQRSDADLHRLQGVACNLKDMLDLAANARGIMHKKQQELQFSRRVGEQNQFT